jgi:hypothetical protein
VVTFELGRAGIEIEVALTEADSGRKTAWVMVMTANIATQKKTRGMVWVLKMFN